MCVIDSEAYLFDAWNQENWLFYELTPCIFNVKWKQGGDFMTWPTACIKELDNNIQ